MSFLPYLIIEMLLTWRDILTGSASQQLCVVMNSLVGKSGIIPQLHPPTSPASLPLSAHSHTDPHHISSNYTQGRPKMFQFRTLIAM